MITRHNAQRGESSPPSVLSPLADRAGTILHEWVKSESLRRHCYAVADSLRHFAPASGGDPDLWEAVGLLHDMDYERDPNLERNSTNGHPFVAATWLHEHGCDEAQGFLLARPLPFDEMLAKLGAPGRG